MCAVVTVQSPRIQAELGSVSWDLVIKGRSPPPLNSSSLTILSVSLFPHMLRILPNLCGFPESLL